MRIILFSIVMAVMFGGFAQFDVATATSIGFSNSTISATPGGSYSVDVIISGLPSGEIVSAYDLDILYNPALLTINPNTVLFSSLLSTGQQEARSGGSGVINIAAYSFLWDQELADLQGNMSGNSLLATLTFEGIGVGTTNLAFDWYQGKDVKGLNALAIAGYGAPGFNEGGAPVPEPGTFLLLGSGLLSLLGFSRRGKISSLFR